MVQLSSHLLYYPSCQQSPDWLRSEEQAGTDKNQSKEDSQQTGLALGLGRSLRIHGVGATKCCWCCPNNTTSKQQRRTDPWISDISWTRGLFEMWVEKMWQQDCPVWLSEDNWVLVVGGGGNTIVHYPACTARESFCSPSSQCVIFKQATSQLLSHCTGTVTYLSLIVNN